MIVIASAAAAGADLAKMIVMASAAAGADLAKIVVMASAAAAAAGADLAKMMLSASAAAAASQPAGHGSPHPTMTFAIHDHLTRYEPELPTCDMQYTKPLVFDVTRKHRRVRSLTGLTKGSAILRPGKHISRIRSFKGLLKVYTLIKS
jgi:hypothetical protein